MHNVWFSFLHFSVLSSLGKFFLYALLPLHVVNNWSIKQTFHILPTVQTLFFHFCLVLRNRSIKQISIKLWADFFSTVLLQISDMHSSMISFHYVMVKGNIFSEVWTSFSFARKLFLLLFIISGCFSSMFCNFYCCYKKLKSWKIVLSSPGKRRKKNEIDLHAILLCFVPEEKKISKLLVLYTIEAKILGGSF